MRRLGASKSQELCGSPLCAGFRGGEIGTVTAMPLKKLAFVAIALALGGCLSDTLDPTPDSALKPRDKKLLASAPYLNHKPGEGWLRHLVEYSGKEKPGTVVIDTDRKFLYLVLDNGKAYRYGVTVGEEGMSWRGTATVGKKTEWPEWTPTGDILKRMPELPHYVSPGPHNPMGARPLSLPGQQRHTFPNSRHQPAGIHWAGDFLGLHPHAERGRDRPV